MILNRENVSRGALVVGKQMAAQTDAPIQSVNAPTPGLEWGVFAIPAGTPDGYALTTSAAAAEGVVWAAGTGLSAIAASSLLGNPTSSSAVPEAITLGTGLSFSGTTLVSSGGGGTPGGTSGQIQYDNSGSFGGFTMSGDATLVTSTGVITVTKTSGTAFAASATTDTTNASNISSGTLPIARIANSAVTYAKIQNTSAGSVLLGNPTGSAAAPSEITLGANLSFSGTTLVAATGGAANPGGTANQIQYNSGGTAFAGLTMSGDATLVVSTGVITIGAGAVTLAKQANFAASSLMGNPTGSAAAPSAITLGSGLSFSGTTLVASGGGSGTVTSVSWTGDGTIFTASADTAVTTSGTLTPASLIAQTAHYVLAGPTSGSAAAPTFRALAAADLPVTGLTITQHTSAYNADTISAGTWTCACGSYDNHSATLAAATTLALSGATVGQWIRVRAQQAASGGPYALTQPSGVTWFTPSFSAPAMPTTASGVLIVAFYCTGSGTYDGFLVGTSST